MFISLQCSQISWGLISLFISVSVHQAEARLAAKRAARAEAREIRMRELERQQKEVSIENARLMWIHAFLHITVLGRRNRKDFLSLVGAVGAVWTDNVSCQVSFCSSGGAQQSCGSRVTGCKQRAALSTAPAWLSVGIGFKKILTILGMHVNKPQSVGSVSNVTHARCVHGSNANHLCSEPLKNPKKAEGKGVYVLLSLLTKVPKINQNRTESLTWPLLWCRTADLHGEPQLFHITILSLQ